jgi:hypothetical protein
MAPEIMWVIVVISTNCINSEDLASAWNIVLLQFSVVLFSEFSVGCLVFRGYVLKLSQVPWDIIYMIHILVPGRPLHWHVLACAQLQSIESINSILEVGSSEATAGSHDTDSGQCLFTNNVSGLMSVVDRIAVLVEHVEFPNFNKVSLCFPTFLPASSDIWTLGITYPTYMQPEDLATVLKVPLLIDKSRVHREFQPQTWQSNSLHELTHGATGQSGSNLSAVPIQGERIPMLMSIEILVLGHHVMDSQAHE